MYSDSEKRIPFWIPLLILAIAAVLVVGIFSAGGTRGNLSQESADAIKDAVTRSAKQCYVVEGVYPPDLAYLEDNYGLQVNKKDYYVTYNAFASNLPPTVIVTPKHE